MKMLMSFALAVAVFAVASIDNVEARRCCKKSRGCGHTVSCCPAPSCAAPACGACNSCEPSCAAPACGSCGTAAPSCGAPACCN